MMDRDSITRTGARTPGVKRQWPLNGGVPGHRVPRLRTRIRRYRQRGARRADASHTSRRTRRRRVRHRLIYRPSSRTGENPLYGW